MIDILFNNPLLFIFWVLALVIAITVHEFAHAFTADRLGDPTPRIQGRLTLNPLAHLDPLGTLMLFLVRFGWGKPVQFDPFNLENPNRDSALISLAGPASNLALATLASLALRFISPIGHILIPLITLNIILAVFNFLPIHPLDGFKIVGGFLSAQHYRQWLELRSYGTFILLLLILPFGPEGPLIATIISPPINFLLNLLLPSVKFI